MNQVTKLASGKVFLSGTFTMNNLAGILKDNIVDFTMGVTITNPQIAKDYIAPLVMHRQREVFGILFLTSNHNVIDFEIAATGTIDAAAVYPRQIAKSVLKNNAAKVILVHNHPSGSIEPSDADKRITKKLVDALNLFDVKILDHFIVGGNGDIFSFSEEGLI